MALKITDTKTGKTYYDYYKAEDSDGGLDQLCIDAGLQHQLVYCDIECLASDGETWYMLDECSNWAYLPSYYKVERS